MRRFHNLFMNSFNRSLLVAGLSGFLAFLHGPVNQRFIRRKSLPITRAINSLLAWIYTALPSRPSSPLLHSLRLLPNVMLFLIRRSSFKVTRRHRRYLSLGLLDSKPTVQRRQDFTSLPRCLIREPN